jgi:hypothetical protein
MRRGRPFALVYWAKGQVNDVSEADGVGVRSGAAESPAGRPQDQFTRQEPSGPGAGMGLEMGYGRGLQRQSRGRGSSGIAYGATTQKTLSAASRTRRYCASRARRYSGHRQTPEGRSSQRQWTGRHYPNIGCHDAAFLTIACHRLFDDVSGIPGEAGRINLVVA